jgi:hypothetical protein
VAEPEVEQPVVDVTTIGVNGEVDWPAAGR